MKLRLDLYYVKKNLYKLNFKSIYQKTTEKSSENYILANGNNSCKRRSSVMKLEFDLYYVKTNSYTKFQVNILKDDWEKFGKPSGRTPSGLTDRRTDRRMRGQTDGRTYWLTDDEVTYTPWFHRQGTNNKALEKRVLISNFILPPCW